MTHSAENDTPRVNGHAVERYALGWRCGNCDARLLTLMQFQGVQCPGRVIPPGRGDGS